MDFIWSLSRPILLTLRMRTSSYVRQQQPVNMAGVGFRRWAQALSKGKGSGISALLSGCRAGSWCNSVKVSYCLVNFFEDTYQNSKLKASNGRNLDVLTLAFASYGYFK